MTITMTLPVAIFADTDTLMHGATQAGRANGYSGDWEPDDIHDAIYELVLANAPLVGIGDEESPHFPLVVTFSVFDHDLFRDSLEELGVALVDGTSQAFLYALMQPTSPVDMGFEIVSTRALISAHERLEAMHQAQQALATNAGSVLGR